MSEYVSVIMSRSRHIGTVLLRAFLWSNWTHCGIIDSSDEGDFVIEASPSKGVQRIPLEDYTDKSSEFIILLIPVKNSQRVIDCAKTQIGKPYDWLGVIGIGFRRHWQNTGRWFCSELIAWAFEEAGEPLFIFKTWRITPRDVAIPNWRRNSPTIST